MPVPALVWSVFNVLALVALRRVHPPARSRGFTVAWVAVCALAMAPWAWLAWRGWRAFDDIPEVAWGVSIAVELAALGMTLGFMAWGPLVAWMHRASTSHPVDTARRAWLQRAGWAVPAGAASISSAGVAAAALVPMVRHVDLAWPDLPAGLDGMKVGHFTDIHVGTFVKPEQVGLALDALDAERCDLVVMTGDLHDDPALVEAVNRQFARCKAPLGLWGVLGNHEYYAGLDSYFAAIKDGPLRLLVDEGVRVERNGASLWLAGVDYPFQGLDGPVQVARASMADAVKGRADDEFTLCMAHHPSCFDAAAEKGVHLTLSGHTHGGQVAVVGTGLFGGLFRYMLGLYEAGQSKLYVSSGLGHWFPFRLGLPPEVVVYTLRRSTTVA